MNFAQSIVTPEELQCLLGWPTPDGIDNAANDQTDLPCLNLSAHTLSVNTCAPGDFALAA